MQKLKKKDRKLTLHKETVRDLNNLSQLREEELKAAVGNGTSREFNSNCCAW